MSLHFNVILISLIKQKQIVKHVFSQRARHVCLPCPALPFPLLCICRCPVEPGPDPGGRVFAPGASHPLRTPYCGAGQPAVRPV